MSRRAHALDGRQPVQLFSQQRGAGRAIARRLGQQPLQQLNHRGRHFRDEPRQALPAAALQVLEDLELAIARNERRAQQHFGQHHTQREQIRPCFDALALRLLGRHVADLATELTGRGAHVRPGRVHDAEVRQFHLARATEQNVVRRHVAMHNPERRVVVIAVLVRVGQAGRDLTRNV